MNKQLDWDELKVFLAVARAGSLSAASRLLGVSQPTMGRKISHLESDLGKRLFLRTPEGFELTEDGLLTLQYAERIEGEFFAMGRSLTGTEQHISGQIRVSAPDWVGDYLLAPLFAEFLALHPQVTIELVTDFRSVNLNRREADLAIRLTPFEDPDIVQRHLGGLAYGVYLRRGASLQVEAVQLITMDSQFENLEDVNWFKNIFPDSRVVFKSNSRTVQARYCENSDAVVMLPRLLGDSFQGLQLLSVDQTPPNKSLWVGYHGDLRNLARLRRLIDFIQGKLAAVIN